MADPSNTNAPLISCRNCDRVLTWHAVGQRYVHIDTGHQWCFEDRQGYDQPRATPKGTTR